MRATIGERGQVTIPKALRDRLGIRPGEQLEFSEQPGGLLLRKAGVLERIEAVEGTLRLGMTTDEFVDLLRGPAELPADPAAEAR